MTKAEFFAALRRALDGLPEEEIQKSLDYYEEMIDDRMEDSTTEANAVAEMGPVDRIAAQIIGSTPLPTLVKNKMAPRRAHAGWEVGLIVLGAPLWGSLLLTAAAGLLSVLLVLWSIAAAVYAVDALFAAAAIGSVVICFVLPATNGIAVGLAAVGCGLFCAGAAILLFFGAGWLAHAMCWVSRKLMLGVKLCFVRKGNVQ